jgi:hypothetical protein
MTISTIRELHRKWADRVIPKDAPPVQRQEMERAFYSGAFAIFKLQMEEVTALPDDAAEVAMSEINAELVDYFRLLGTIPGPAGTERQ